MENKVIVTGCGDCPFYGDYMIGDSCEHACYHPKHPDKWNSFAPLFSDCPLKQHSLTIELSNDADGVDR